MWHNNEDIKLISAIETFVEIILFVYEQLDLLEWLMS